MKTFTSIAALLGSLSCADPALACSNCGCNLTSDWLSQGLVAQPGTTIGLRYDYVPQTELRSGQDAIDRNAITLPANREIEQNTYNQYATLTLDHAFNPQWAVNVQVPFSWRPHHTISPGDTDQSYSRTHGLGDVRASVRYQGFGGPVSLECSSALNCRPGASIRTSCQDLQPAVPSTAAFRQAPARLT